MSYNKALITKLTIVFIFTLGLFIFAFFSFSNIQEENSNEKVIQRYTDLSAHFQQNRFRRENVIEYLQGLNFKLVQNPHMILQTLTKPIVRKRGFEMVQKNDKYYFHVITPHFQVLFEDMNQKVERDPLYFIVFGFILILFIIIYLLILKNIKDSALLLNSRQLFLRTVMHELKTPIAKGRIVSELIDNEKQRSRLTDIFEKLNFLIDDFAKVEQIVSKNYHAHFHTFTVDEIISRSVDMLLLDKEDEKIIKNFQSDTTLKVDIDLIALAIKNLLDNGIKYSSDHKVSIEIEENKLLIISKGVKLPKSLNEYFKPFHNETKDKNHGMGLGLYIVFSILSLHKFTLKHQYIEGKNIFSILY